MWSYAADVFQAGQNLGTDLKADLLTLLVVGAAAAMLGHMAGGRIGRIVVVACCAFATAMFLVPGAQDFVTSTATKIISGA